MILNRNDPENPIVLTSTSNELNEDCACPDSALVLTFEGEPSDLDNDCACPDRPFAFVQPVVSSRVFTQTPGTLIAILPHGFRLAFSPYAPMGPSVLNTPAWVRLQTFVTPQPITQPVDHTFVAQRLVQPAGATLTSHAGRPETLTAWLHITNACNLDCPYCYVRKSSARMSKETGLRAIKQIFRTAQENGFKRIKLKYAGGESTLHFNLVRQLHEFASQRADETGLKLREVVLSNGTRIRPADAEWLNQAGIKLMISLDGIGEMHNRLRPRKGGGESFSSIETTIDRILLPRNIRPDITITVTRINASGIADAVRWVLERALPVSLNFYRQNILSASHQELALEEKDIIDGMLAAYAVFETYLPVRPFLNGLLDRVQAEAHSHTCGVGSAYLVITHEGKLAQCQMHLDNPVGTISDSAILQRVAIGPIRNMSVDQKTGCQECEFRYRCTGGCPLETFRATGRWDVSSPNCHIYKTLLPAALRLEGLRLIKQHCASYT